MLTTTYHFALNTTFCIEGDLKGLASLFVIHLDKGVVVDESQCRFEYCVIYSRELFIKNDFNKAHLSSLKLLNFSQNLEIIKFM